MLLEMIAALTFATNRVPAIVKSAHWQSGSPTNNYHFTLGKETSLFYTKIF